MNCLFLDFKSAYNYVNRERIYMLIEKHGILENIEVDFLRKLQSNQYFEKINK